MNPWVLGSFLTVSLAAGFLAGWYGLRGLRIRMPNAWVSFAVLLAGSVGGPVLTYHLLGGTPLSYASAVALSGFAAGATFWPMGLRQGEQEWL